MMSTAARVSNTSRWKLYTLCFSWLYTSMYAQI